MAKVSIKRNDTKVIFTDTLTVNNTPVDLTDCIVSFLIKKGSSGGIKRTADILQTAPPPDPSAGKVQYQVIADDVANKGEFKEEWEVIFPGGQILTFPNDGWNLIEILEDLG